MTMASMARTDWLRAAAASVMLGASLAMPPMGQRHTPTFERSVQYDGDGKKVKAKRHPRHNASKHSMAWTDYATRVRRTHSEINGRRQTDPRDDKYLHSHARAMRGLVAALDRRSAA
jgi:hypothetical protein